MFKRENFLLACWFRRITLISLPELALTRKNEGKFRYFQHGILSRKEIRGEHGKEKILVSFHYDRTSGA